MSTMITPTRPPHDATAPTDDEGHRRSERSGDVDAAADRTDGPPSAGPGDRSGAPPSSTRLRRFGGFFGRHRWLAALAVIVALAALAGLGTALQGTGTGDASTSGATGAALPDPEVARAEPDGGVSTKGAQPAAGVPNADQSGAAAEVTTDEVTPGIPIGPTETPQVTGVDRDLVRTATLDLTAKEPDTAAAKARSLVGALGGRVAQEQTSFSGNSSVVLTLAIPPKNFDAAMEQLSELGKVKNRSVSTDDVTGTVTDLEGRITTLKASITRLQGFLADASDAGQIGMLESELLRRETELEGIQGQLRTIEAQVAESTVTLTITETGKRLDPVIDEDDGVGFIDGLTSGWNAFTAVVNAIVVAMAAIAPFLAIGLVVWLVVRLIRRRRDAGASVVDAASSNA